METTLREESALAVCLSVIKHAQISFTELVLRNYITFHYLIIFHLDWKSSVEKLSDHLYLKALSSLCWSCSRPVSAVSLILNRRQSLFPSAFLIFFATGSHLTFLVTEEQGISLLFGSTLFLPCSKQPRDLSAVMGTHVILVWWDLLSCLSENQSVFSFSLHSPLGSLNPGCLHCLVILSSGGSFLSLLLCLWIVFLLQLNKFVVQLHLSCTS